VDGFHGGQRHPAEIGLTPGCLEAADAERERGTTPRRFEPFGAPIRGES
jgi:hypothetical protein